MRVLTIVLAAICLYSCKSKNNEAYKKIVNDPILYSATVKELNDVVLENSFPPMIASRNYAYASIAAYECVSAGNTKYKTLVGKLNGLMAFNAPSVKFVDYKLAALLSFIKVGNTVTFPEGSMVLVYDKIIDSVEKAGISSNTLNDTKTFSDSMVSHIMKWSKGDNYGKTRSGEKYGVRFDDPARWIPTPPAYAQAVEFLWPTIRTMAIDSASQFKPIPPPVFNIADKNSTFYKAAYEVLQVGKALTDDQKHIANFFDDNPNKMNVVGHVMFATKKFSPPGHWLNIVGIAAAKSKFDFEQTVQAYAYTSIALFDGFISCWDEKYRSNLVRPETVINKSIDADWRPLIQTPPFPSYTSGHSVVSAAAAEVMTSLFGENFAYRDSSEREFGIDDRNFTSFKHAAQEASMSRLYGGIHYRFDLDEGIKQGEKLGKFICEKIKNY